MNECIEPLVIKKFNQFVFFMFGVIQLPDILNFLGRAASLDFFLKVNETSETENYFPYEWFDDPEKPYIAQLPPYETFFSKLRNNNLPEKKYSDCQGLIDGGFTSEEA